jgi:hypothetical protein
MESYEDKNPDQVWLSDLKTAIQKYDKSGLVALDNKEFSWLSLEGEDYGTIQDERSFVTSPKFIEDFVKTQVMERKGKVHTVKTDDLGLFSVDGQMPITKKAAVLKLAYDFSIPAKDAMELIKQASKDKKSSFYLFDKKASIFATEVPQTAQGMPGDPNAMAQMQQGGMPPEMDPQFMNQNTEINPQFMDAAQSMDNEGLFNVSTLLALNKRQMVRNIFKDYFGTFKETLDALGRVLFTLWVKEPDLVKELSLESYQEIEDNVRLLFMGLGDLLLTTAKDSEILTK